MRRWSSPPTSSRLEGVVAIFGLVLLLALLGYTFYLALAAPETPALITVAAGEVSEFDAGFHVSFTATNVGRATAGSVEIEGRLLGTADEEIESSTATVTFVPGGSSRQGGLFFSSDPRELRLELRATGYESP